MAYDDGRKPLYSLESEQAVLGAILFDNFLYHEIAGFLNYKHFFDPVHGLIFEACSKLIRAHAMASPVSVAASLDGAPGFTEAGGKDYLERCAACVPSSVGAKDYARVVFEYAQRRGLAELGAKMAARASAGTFSDEVGSQMADAERAIRELAEAGIERKTEWLGTSADQWLAEAEAADGRIPGAPTGLSDLDRAIGGFQSGSLFVLAGRPSMGKSALGLGLARAAALQGFGVHIASMEMDRKKLWARMLSDLARDMSGIPYSEIGARKFFNDEGEILHGVNDILKDMPIAVDQRSGPSAEQVAASARRSMRKFEAKGVRLGLVVVDYLQLMALDRSFAGNPSIAIGLQTKAMKALAEDLGCTVLLLSQLSRGVEGREGNRPTLSDLRQSGEIEQDADIVGFILRPEYYLERQEKPDEDELRQARGVLRLFLDKNRNGPIASLKFDCDIACNAVRPWGTFHCRLNFGGH